MRVSTLVRVLLFAGLLGRPLWAEEAEGGPTDGALLPRASESSVREARHHFERALAEYRAGNYRRAIAELDQALAEDPTGKDLVFNLALVHEKLGELDRAIAYLERFVQMETDPTERARAEQAIVRMRGAQRHALAATQPIASAPAPQPAPAPAPERPRYGRFDGWVIGAGTVAVAAVVVGVVFGVRALDQHAAFENLADDPDATVSELSERAESAQASSMISNAAFALGIAAGGGAVVLYFARPEIAPEKKHTADARHFAIAVSAPF